MVSDNTNEPFRNKDKDESSDLKAFAENRDAEHANWKQQKATGTQKFMDEQNKTIDTHNLRK